MNAGFGNKSLVVAGVLIFALATIGNVTISRADTPASACALDSLYLVSPDIDGIDIRMQLAGTQGVVLSWPDLDITEATCYSVTGTDDFDFEVDVDGDFSDLVDRVFEFTASSAGIIGGSGSQRVDLSWGTSSNSQNGYITGRLNLANNGGTYRYSHVTSSWSQVNSGLPMNKRQINIVAIETGQGDFRLAGLTSGLSNSSEIIGLLKYDGTQWIQISSEFFGSTELITKIAVSPANNDHFAVGTSVDGIFVTTDGGATFTNWKLELDPVGGANLTNFKTSGLKWGNAGLFVSISQLGVFRSTDNGSNFTKLDFEVLNDLDAPGLGSGPPRVNSFAIDPTNDNRILAALSFHGIYETIDAGDSWQPLYGDLVVVDPDVLGSWTNTALDVAIDPNNPQAIIAGIELKGLYRSTDGGEVWVKQGTITQQDGPFKFRTMNLAASSVIAGLFYIMVDDFGMFVSNNFGVDWDLLAEQPLLNSCTTMALAKDGTGDLIVGSDGGGIFIPGTTLSLSSTMLGQTDADLRDVELGLTITIGDGNLQEGDSFELNCQTFQGWAVWRAFGHDANDMTMIGLYDRVNPETCIQGYCGDTDFAPIPQCWQEKRSACFNFDNPDTIRFFDSEVYNGFSYYYAITAFDYGNTAEVTSAGLTQGMLISPRWDEDPVSIFGGPGNRTEMQVNSPVQPAKKGEEIYVYPNPLRSGLGLPGSEGTEVVFSNLPDESSIRIFTLAGDNLITLEPSRQVNGNIYWDTRNDSNESLASGVYIYKVNTPEREPYWGRLVIIR